ncbi:MAG: type II toxin-antitoxin system death-on-curing family toxin [Acidimicrobiales bacterium]|jgi:death-on-curing protein
MIDVEYLELDDALEMIRSLKIGPVRDIGLLDSAIHRPRSTAFGEDAYPTVALKAAALLQSLTKNHAFVDGNKRLAWLCTVVVCDLNGHQPDLTDDEAFHVVWDVASTDMDVVEIAERLQLLA